MGGKAFTTAKGNDPALLVPRMEPAVYFELKQKYLGLLGILYRLVACPVEAPGKDSYGDIDIVVSDPDDIAFESVYQHLPAEKRLKSVDPPKLDIRFRVLLHILQARRHLSSAGTMSFAVSHPTIADAFVQLDINHQSPDLHAWHVFHHSHGDLWNILGTSIRAFGLTITEDGVYVRDPDIDKLDRKRGRVFLTREPMEVLDWLGLDFDEWNRGWPTEAAMFRYSAKSKLFRPGLYTNKSDLKANDRKRLGQRPCFRRFIEEFIPSYISGQTQNEGIAPAAVGADDERTWVEVDRDGAREEVLKRFDARQRYDENHRTWIEEREALDRKRVEKAERRAAHEAANEAARLRKLQKEAEADGSKVDAA